MTVFTVFLPRIAPWLLPIAAYSALAAGEIRVQTGPGESPLSWEPLENGATSTPDFIRQRAATYVARDSLQNAPTFVEFRDTCPFGEESPVSGWLVEIPSVEVRRLWGESGDAIEVDLYLLVSDDDGRLLAAFTKSKDTWVLPLLPPVNPEEKARSLCESFAPLSRRELESPVSEVISSVWRSNRDLTKTGQIIMRPRTVVTDWPPIVRNGVMIPDVRPRTYWIIVLLGMVTGQWPEDPYPYRSGHLQLTLDGSPEVYKTTTLP